MSVDFIEIPINWKVPGVIAEIDASRAKAGLAIQPYHALLFGQKISAGTATPDIPISVPTADTADTLFGAGSHAARAVKAFREENQTIPLSVIPLDDAGGSTTATGTITFGGTPAAVGGSVYIYVAGKRYAVAVNASMTVMAADLAAQVSANTDSPSAAAVNPGTLEEVIFSAVNGGECGNEIDLRHSYNPGEVIPSGLTVAIVAMSGGSGNPVLTTAITNMGDEQYNVIALPYTDATSLSAIETELADRFDAIRAIEGVVVAASVGTVGVLQALGQSRNSKHVGILGLESFPGIAFERAVRAAAVFAEVMQNDPARPAQTLGIRGLPAAPEARFTSTEQNMLLLDGVSTIVTQPGSQVAIGRLVSTHREDHLGGADDRWFDLNMPLLTGYYRYAWTTRMNQRYPRHKLAVRIERTDESSALVTPMSVKAESLAWYGQLEDRGLAQDKDGFADDSVFEINSGDPSRLDVVLAIRPVYGLRVIATKIQHQTITS